jgi:hypothetical protein
VTPQRPPAPAPRPRDEHSRLTAVEESVAGVAREHHRLRATVEPLAGLPERVDELADVVTDLATKLAAVTARRAPTPCPSWLLAPTDPDAVSALLDGLRGWLDVVYLRYPDGASGLPECWCWHPDVVEELLWLMHAWLAAYQGPAASVALAADWHDRHRPGVVRRITKAAGSCSRERHQTRAGWDAPEGPPTAPGADATTAIVAWWATRRDQAGPEPPARADDGAPAASDGGRAP